MKVTVKDIFHNMQIDNPISIDSKGKTKRFNDLSIEEQKKIVHNKYMSINYPCSIDNYATII